MVLNWEPHLSHFLNFLYFQPSVPLIAAVVTWASQCLVDSRQHSAPRPYFAAPSLAIAPFVDITCMQRHTTAINLGSVVITLTYDQSE